MSVLRYTPTDDGTQDLDLEPTQRDDETDLASDDEPGANEVRVSPEPPRNQASTSNNLMQPNLEQPIEGRPRSFSELFSWYEKLKVSGFWERRVLLITKKEGLIRTKLTCISSELQQRACTAELILARRLSGSVNTG